MRTTLICLLLATTSLACDSKTQDGGAAASASAANTPAVTVVAREVTLQKTITRGASASAEEGESWTAFEGQTYVVVSTDIVHNRCADGDEVDKRKAALVLADGKKVEATGGGEDRKSLCLLCEAKRSAECSGGQSPMRPFTFVFSVPEDTKVAEAKLTYLDGETALSVAEIKDQRGDESVQAEVKALRERVAALQKKLENTSNVPAGKLIEDEIEDLKKKIQKLESKGQ